MKKLTVIREHLKLMHCALQGENIIASKEQTHRDAKPASNQSPKRTQAHSLTSTPFLSPASLSVNDIVQLQRAIGNQAVIQLLRTQGVRGSTQSPTPPNTSGGVKTQLPAQPLPVEHGIKLSSSAFAALGSIPFVMRMIDPLPKKHVTGNIFHWTKTRTLQQKITEYNKTSEDNLDKRQELLMVIQKTAQAWLSEHGEDESEGGGGKGWSEVSAKEDAIRTVLEQAQEEMNALVKQRTEENSGFVDEEQGPDQVSGGEAIGHVAGGYGMADPLTATTTGHGVASQISGIASGKGPDPRLAEDLVGSFKRLFDSLQNPKAAALAGMKESLSTITGQIAAVAVPGIGFTLAVAGYVDARDTKSALQTSIKALKDELGLRTADTESLLLSGAELSESLDEESLEEVAEEDVPMIDLSGEAEAEPEESAERQDLLDSLLYAERKVLRRYIDSIYNIIDTGISLVGSIAALVVPIAGLAKVAIDSGKAALNAIKVIVRKVKGLYKLATGKRGKRRFETAQQIVEAALTNDPIALKLIVALDPGGMAWAVERATWGKDKYQAFPSWPENAKDMLALIKLMVQYNDLKSLHQMIADKFKSVA